MCLPSCVRCYFCGLFTIQAWLRKFTPKNGSVDLCTHTCTMIYICWCVCMYLYLSINLSIHPSIHLSNYPSVHLSIYRYVCVSVIICIQSGYMTNNTTLYFLKKIYICIYISICSTKNVDFADPLVPHICAGGFQVLGHALLHPEASQISQLRAVAGLQVADAANDRG